LWATSVEWQVPASSLLFFILGTGNVYTTCRVVINKVKTPSESAHHHKPH
jgi:hypothetical protein